MVQNKFAPIISRTNVMVFY